MSTLSQYIVLNVYKTTVLAFRGIKTHDRCISWPGNKHHALSQCISWLSECFIIPHECWQNWINLCFHQPIMGEGLQLCQFNCVDLCSGLDPANDFDPQQSMGCHWGAAVRPCKHGHVFSMSSPCQPALGWLLALYIYTQWPHWHREKTSPDNRLITGVITDVFEAKYDDTCYVDVTHCSFVLSISIFKYYRCMLPLTTQYCIIDGVLANTGGLVCANVTVPTLSIKTINRCAEKSLNIPVTKDNETKL